MTKKCFLCAHPLRGQIDSLCSVWQSTNDDDLDGLVDQINDEIELVYGAEARRCQPDDLEPHLAHTLIPTRQSLAGNRQSIKMGGVDYQVPTPEEAIIAILAAGMQNLRLQPDLITPNHMLRALMELRQLGMSLDDERLEAILADKLREMGQPGGDAPLRPPPNR